MRDFEFSAAVLEQIRHDRFSHPDPGVQRRMEVLWLKAHGQRHQDIAELVGLSRATVQRVLELYGTGGLVAVRSYRRYRPESALRPYRLTLEEEFVQRPPHTVAEAAQRIEQLTGIRRKETQVRQFLREQLELRWRKVAAVPVPPKQTLPQHAATQAAFLKDEASTASGRGSKRQASGLFRRCRPLCAGVIPGLAVVQNASARQGCLGPSALQRSGGVQCHQP